MTNMYFALLFTILTIILPGFLAVHPGDPFPKQLAKLKIITSEDLTNVKELVDPNDDEFPSSSTSTSTSTSSEPLTDPTDSNNNEEISVDNIITTSIKPTLVTKLRPRTVARKINLDKKISWSIKKSIIIPKSRNDDIDNLDVKPSLAFYSSMLLSTKSLSKKNLIKIGRWKHEDLQTKSIRYWYEPEGGHMGSGWVFDGYVFQAYNKSEPNTEPIYVFHSEIRSMWTNTFQMDPKCPMIGNDQWISDGVSFYAYKTSLNTTELQPVFRYWNKLKPGTTDATETRITYLTMKQEEINQDDQFEWTFDDILFYALPIKD